MSRVWGALTSSTVNSSVRARSLTHRLLMGIPPPKRPRAKSRTFTMRRPIRIELLCMADIRPNARLSVVLVTNSSALICNALSGVRKSWPSTAMNCSRRRPFSWVSRLIAINCAGLNNGNGNVAFQPVGFGCVVLRVERMSTGIGKNDRH